MKTLKILLKTGCGVCPADDLAHEQALELVKEFAYDDAQQEPPQHLPIVSGQLMVMELRGLLVDGAIERLIVRHQRRNGEWQDAQNEPGECALSPWPFVGERMAHLTIKCLRHTFRNSPHVGDKRVKNGQAQAPNGNQGQDHE